MLTVSPRARGSAAQAPRPAWRSAGQSARARERPTFRVNPAGALWSVRAREGAPPARHFAVRKRPVSPRARGSAPGMRDSAPVVAGQSARARERPHGDERTFAPCRSVRAREGAPFVYQYNDGNNQVSPRARGSACGSPSLDTYLHGQSARARERRGPAHTRVRSRRSVRAREGAPQTRRYRACHRQVSPRARGSAAGIARGANPSRGQSARARERRAFGASAWRLWGSVRAREGAPGVANDILPITPVSPRARGSAACAYACYEIGLGQSARARERRLRL